MATVVRARMVSAPASPRIDAARAAGILDALSRVDLKRRSK
jgi:hypothetical protein